MNKIELLEKIDKQCGYIDAIDAFSLVSIFTDEFGIRFTNLSIEEELKWMYLKLKGYNIRSVEFEMSEKRCNKCNIIKNMDSFYINSSTHDGRHYTCKVCCSKTGRIRDSESLEIEKDKIKKCGRCKIEKRHAEFKPYYYKEKKWRKPNCIQCDKEVKEFLQSRKK